MNHISKSSFIYLVGKFFFKTVPGLKSNLRIEKFSYNNIFFKPLYKFLTFPISQSVFSKQLEPEMFKLQQQYKEKQNLSIFQPSIHQSTGVNDQMTIFKIFKVMQISPFNQQSYENFFEVVNNMSKKKSDNILLLLASIKKKIAQNYKKQQNFPKAIQCLEEALDILEYSMVPPLFPYYSIYRDYGLLHDTIGELQKAKQILTQTVDILDDFVSNSDDAVSTNDYCKNMASTYNCLARIDLTNKNKWTDKAENSWTGFTQNKYNEVEYAKTVSLNIKKLLKEDKEKGWSYFHFNLYKFENNDLKDLLKKAKEQASV